jgi:hypothetical protein
MDWQLRIASKQPIHFPEIDVELIKFFLNTNLKVAGSRPDEVNDFYKVT